MGQIRGDIRMIEHDLQAEIARLNQILTPDEWTPEQQKAWRGALPNTKTQAAFDALRAVPVSREGYAHA